MGWASWLLNWTPPFGPTQENDNPKRFFIKNTERAPLAIKYIYDPKEKLPKEKICAIARSAVDPVDYDYHWVWRDFETEDQANDWVFLTLEKNNWLGKMR